MCALALSQGNEVFSVKETQSKVYLIVKECMARFVLLWSMTDKTGCSHAGGRSYAWWLSWVRIRAIPKWSYMA